MKVDLGDLNAFVAVAQAGGFRDVARTSGTSASGLSEAVRRLEAQLAAPEPVAGYRSESAITRPLV